jgi:hypothetical protein
MTNAKQTAMLAHGLTTWPASNVRSQAACDCRGYACVLMRDAGYSKRETAKQLGFEGCSSVLGAIRRYELRHDRSHLDALLSYFTQLKPARRMV